MPDQKRNKRRELLSRVVMGAVAGSVIGLGVGILHKTVNRKSSICTRITDTMLIGGVYAIVDKVIENYNVNHVYRPIVTGAIAGGLGSRGGALGIATTSAMTAGAAYALENANVFGRPDIE
ncbi:uncharacterized protein NEMAJ01_0157 [Nematocida major]|uniref:uncharacterized protein n=1 Tax=Nematocida major TaxID=1912982 RepID=UPI002008A7A5|nr:uncharacterized protein NEMAJ01_0157 [Nematocida major]KAH9385261.1 hypothetical protein NEMAJ01_0157 [Nematocida major]